MHRRALQAVLVLAAEPQGERNFLSLFDWASGMHGAVLADLVRVGVKPQEQVTLIG